MAKAQKVIVSERAVIARINRNLAKDSYEALKVSRSEAMRRKVGRYYSIDQNRNCILGRHIDVEAWARELGVLKPYEQMETAA